jgi:hypothetical protein
MKKMIFSFSLLSLLLSSSLFASVGIENNDCREESKLVYSEALKIGYSKKDAHFFQRNFKKTCILEIDRHVRVKKFLNYTAATIMAEEYCSFIASNKLTDEKYKEYMDNSEFFYIKLTNWNIFVRIP